MIENISIKFTKRHKPGFLFYAKLLKSSRNTWCNVPWTNPLPNPAMREAAKAFPPWGKRERGW
jgi:hypothetical protein